MKENLSNPHVAFSTEGDVLIVQGPGSPVLFFPRSQVPVLQSKPESANALVVSDVGSAAIAAMLSARAKFNASVAETGAVITDAVFTFTLHNRMVGVYSTDPNYAETQEQRQRLGIDVLVTDTSLKWDRENVEIVGAVVSHFPQVPTQLFTLGCYAPAYLAEVVRQAMDEQARIQTTSAEEKK